LTVPGGTVGCGGTTVIAVLPTHRRRGVLTEMMRFHLDEVAGRSEPVAALWASEAPIYGRFGYGVATQFFRIKLNRNRLSFPRPPLGGGTVRILDLDEAREVLPGLYERIRPQRPGFLTRPDRRWEGAHFYDPPEWRDGGTSNRWALYEESGEPLGYVPYRQHEKWDGGLAANRVVAGSMHAASPAAEEALWRYLLGIDLVATIESWNTDPASVLSATVADARRVERTISDGMWVRILDVPGALAARRYQVDGRLVLEISDPFRGSASGTFALEGGPSGATCGPATDVPDIRLDVRELGSVYLGGFSFSELARAGLVDGTPDALRTADLMFGWHVRPWCPEVF
ncbi:MAG: GNAT family N-acetyltransferase, partial [Acidimicrobiia bacterium]|nr:GNAT family N-acetyltransferase [Acidimicrobiia bacterium]